jgi:K+-sensing histidine kinase KdpD
VATVSTLPVLRRTLRVFLSVAIVAGIGLAEFRLGRLNHTTVALTLLMAVLAIATWWGLPELLVASVAGMLCFNYLFLPPVGTWTVADPENWVALVTFVATATVASQLSASAKRRAAAQARAEEAVGRAQAARQSEEMKSAMLDSPTSSKLRSRRLKPLSPHFAAVRRRFQPKANSCRSWRRRRTA